MRIVVVGGGVAGLVAAEILGHAHDVTLLEASDRLGGHARTLDVTLDGRRFAVDAGFVVFNEPNYPLFNRLLTHLGVARRPSDMSFSVRHDAAGLEYAARSKGLYGALFAQWRNLLRPRFWRMLKGVRRLWREAPGWLGEPGSDVTLAERMRRDGYGPQVTEWHLYPMVAALWSAPRAEVLGFPARTLAAFFHQHAFFRHDRPDWYTIEGGSRAYVERLAAALPARVHVATPATRVRRRQDVVEVDTAGGTTFHAEHVVLALHPDDALGLLEAPTPAEREALGALRYQANDIVVHTDTTVLPRRRRAWASWNAWIPRKGDGAATVTYLANRLHDFEGPPWILISLNLTQAIDPAKVLARMVWRHPQASLQAVAARANRPALQSDLGAGLRTTYVGAGWGYGFHEDGVRSAVEACERLGVRPRW